MPVHDMSSQGEPALIRDQKISVPGARPEKQLMHCNNADCDSLINKKPRQHPSLVVVSCAKLLCPSQPVHL